MLFPEQVLVGFSEYLGIYALLGNGFRKTGHMNMSNCNVVTYSNGGQLFACSAGSRIDIYSTWTVGGSCGCYRGILKDFESNPSVSLTLSAGVVAQHHVAHNNSHSLGIRKVGCISLCSR